MRVLGIDPGASGALVILEDGQPIEWMAMPTMKSGLSTRVNAAAVTAFILFARNLLCKGFSC